MVEGACADKLALGIDFPGYLGGEVTHLDGMLESARGNFAHLTQQFLVHVGQFDEGDVRCETESFFNKIEQRV